MVYIQADFTEQQIRKIDIIKAREGFKNREQALQFIVGNYTEV